MNHSSLVANRESQVGKAFQGLLLTFALAIAAYVTWYLLKDSWLQLSALFWAFIYSIAAGNFLPTLSADRFRAGIELSSTRLLRWTIALLGLTVSASVWSSLGGTGVVLVLVNLIFAFAFGIFFCRHVLKLKGTLAVLIGSGTSICGASAIAAIGPAVKAKEEEMGLSVAVVTLFGLIAMFAYPFLFNGPLSAWFGHNPLAYGMWAGTGVHETAQVIVAGNQVTGALSIALSAKFIRIFMIGPMIFVSLLVNRCIPSSKNAEHIKLAFPWFALIFVLLALVHWGFESSPVRESWLDFNNGYLKPVVNFLLAWSFAGMGLRVRASAIFSVGSRAFAGGMVVAFAAGASALFLVKYLWMPFN